MANVTAGASILFPDHRPARERLEAAVRDLTRARHDQLLLEHVWTGLFWGLVASSAEVALARLLSLSFSPWTGVACLLVAALMVAALVAWRRRPGDLEVAILADLQLKLEQRLSTAWELRLSGADEGLVERLAVQAVRSHKIRMRAAGVFPLRANLWGKLTPVAAVLLLLVGALDVRREGEPAPVVLDPILTSEGERLRDYGLEMEIRAQRQGLPRSVDESQSLQRLGSRMESGALSREEALVRLRQLGTVLQAESHLAVTKGIETPAEPSALEALAESPLLQSSRLRGMLEKLLDGRLDPFDIEALADEAMALSRLGISPEDLQAALERFTEGDYQELRDILERLSRIDRAAREVEELRLAEEQIRLARESLGDIEGFAERRIARIAGGGMDDEDYDTVLVGPPGDRRLHDENVHGAIYVPTRGFGGQTDATNRSGEHPKGIEDTADVVITPRSQPRQGQVHTSEARVLPREASPTLDEIALDPRFSAQVEEVLSKEEVPLHEKEFIRRYFLTLSEQVGAEPGSAP